MTSKGEKQITDLMDSELAELLAHFKAERGFVCQVEPDCEDQHVDSFWPPQMCTRFECQRDHDWVRPRLSLEKRSGTWWWLCPICKCSYGAAREGDR